MKPVTLYYIYDPMCSWCWGFRPVWEKVRSELEKQNNDRLKITYVLGGLAPETSTIMSREMQEYLQQTWRRVEALTGVNFNFDFWLNNQPRRSTYPACKAALVARWYGKELAMYESIQRLYYQQAGNPSDYASLYTLADSIGMNTQTFKQEIHSVKAEQQLAEEVMQAEKLGAQGLPSLVIENETGLHFIEHSYTSVEDNLENLRSILIPG